MSPALGAVIEGVRLDPALDVATIEAIGAALLAHKVVWFRGQSLDGESLTALARRFGTPRRASCTATPTAAIRWRARSG